MDLSLGVGLGLALSFSFCFCLHCTLLGGRISLDEVTPRLIKWNI